MGDLFTQDGYWWPPGCKIKRYLRHMRDAELALPFCRTRKVAVQAGGHMGAWPLALSKHFEKVVTFEPEAANWECLQRNIRKRQDRIEAHRALLGERSGKGTVLVNGGNTGGHKARYDGTGELPVVAIDDLGLERVGLICLDVEGAEWPALKGAVRTICRCRPVIMVEIRGHTEVFGYTPKEMQAWLEQAGYRYVRKVAKDHIWVAARWRTEG